MQRIWYNVNPRYTCGSPAQVPEITAEQVAMEEARTYRRYLKGIYGEDEQEFAKQHGEQGIVFSWMERGKKVLVNDLITQMRHEFPTFDAFRQWSDGHRKSAFSNRRN